MNTEIIIIVVIAFFSILVAIAYFYNPLFIKVLIGENDPFEKKIFRGNFPFWQFMMLTIIFPVSAVLVMLLWNAINSRPLIHAYYLSERNTLWMNVFLLMLIGYGNGTHAASVSIRHYMWKLTITKAFRVAEFYHHILSHFLVIMGIIGLFFMLAIHELSHPLLTPMSFPVISFVTLAGVCGGVVLAFLIIEGRGRYYSYPTLFMGAAFLVFALFDLDINGLYFPMVILDLSLFTSTMLTMFIWRLKNGSYRETIGEFFHQQQEE